MKNKGISLIVLIITIVVIIILGTAIVVNIAKSNVIDNAKEAVIKNDFATTQEAYNMYLASKFLDNNIPIVGRGIISKNADESNFQYKYANESDEEYKDLDISIGDLNVKDSDIESMGVNSNNVTGVEIKGSFDKSTYYVKSSNSILKVTKEEYKDTFENAGNEGGGTVEPDIPVEPEIPSEPEEPEDSVVVVENDALIGCITDVTQTGVTQLTIAGNNGTGDENVTYNINTIYYDGDLILDGTTEVTGATLSNNQYEFGDSSSDVATSSTEAQNMVVLKVNGNLTINEGVTLTACKSASGYGGPKGMTVYCTGTITNNGSISMNSRGAKATGENVYLWKNSDNTFEFVPAVGANGAAKTKNYTRWASGAAGSNGSSRGTAGGGAGACGNDQNGYPNAGYGGAGGAGSSYSGGAGGGAARIYSSSSKNGNAGSSTGGAGGKGVTWSSDWGASGGAGNPGGAGVGNSSLKGSNGTGGLLVIYSNILFNYGTISANGNTGNGKTGSSGGGSSGGGSINIFYGTQCVQGDIQVAGGAPSAGDGKGGAGGTGSISIGSIGTGSYISTYTNY